MEAGESESCEVVISDFDRNEGILSRIKFAFREIVDNLKTQSEIQLKAPVFKQFWAENA